MKKYPEPQKQGKEHFPFSQEKNAQGELYCASDTEMTGLISSGQPNQKEREQYQHIFPYLPPYSNGTPA